MDIGFLMRFRRCVHRHMSESLLCYVKLYLSWRHYPILVGSSINRIIVDSNRDLVFLWPDCDSFHTCIFLCSMSVCFRIVELVFFVRKRQRNWLDIHNGNRIDRDYLWRLDVFPFAWSYDVRIYFCSRNLSDYCMYQFYLWGLYDDELFIFLGGMACRVFACYACICSYFPRRSYRRRHSRMALYRNIVYLLWDISNYFCI